MRIATNQIVEVLEAKGFAYEIIGKPLDEYRPASLFAPIVGGFYFYAGQDPFPFDVEQSLVLTTAGGLAKEPAGNAFLKLLSSDPQQVYYRVLSELFGRRSNGTIASTAIVSPEAKLGKNVQIDDFCILEACEVGDDVVIGSHSRIHANTAIGAKTVIESMSIIGTQGVAWTWNENQTQKVVQPQLGGVTIGSNCFLAANTIVVRGSLNEHTRIGDSTLIAPGCRIGHGTILGNFVHFANNVVTGGNARIGDYAFVGSSAVFRPKVNVHPKTIVGAGSVVVKNTSKEGMTLMGVPAKEMQTKASPSGMPKPKN